MNTDFIKKRLSSTFSIPPSIRGDYDLNPNMQRYDALLTPAVVLVPLVVKEKTITILLTKRNKNLPHHPGQISFPGGRVDTSDKTPKETALREVKEEIGIDRGNIKVIGSLDAYETRTGFSVIPLVGFVYPPYQILPDPDEVAEVFEVPLSFCMNPDNHLQHQRRFKGELRRFYALTYNEYFIWGATAGMIVNLYDLLKLKKTMD